MEDNVVILIEKDGTMTVYIDGDAEISEEQIHLATSVILLDKPSFVLQAILFLEKKFNQLLFLIEEWWRGDRI